MTQAEQELSKGFGYADTKKGYGQITDEAVAALASRIGIERTREPADWELDDSRFTAGRLRRVAFAAGDYNPLYIDMDYARRSPYGTLIAPPWVLTGIEVTNAARDGMPGLHAWFRGTTLEWDRPIKMGDYLTSKGVLTDVRRVKSQTSGEAVVQEYINTGYNQRGEVVGRMFTSWHRAERETSKDIAKNQKMRGLGRIQPRRPDAHSRRLRPRSPPRR